MVQVGITIGVCLALVGALAWFLRQKHRFLFQLFCRETQGLRTEVDRLRRAVRLLEYHQAATPKTGTGLPVRFRSQNGEDTYVWDFFDRRTSGFFIEAGAADGLSFSNTYFMESVGWHGVLVEAHPRLITACRQNRPGSVVVHSALAETASGEIEFNCVDGAAGPGLLSFCEADQAHIQRCASEGFKITTARVTKTTLDVLCAGRKESVDVVFLDLEGFELNALKGFDLERFRPRLLVIEVKPGEQTGSLNQYLAANGYHLGRRVGENNFYVRQEDLNRLMQL